MPNPGAQLLLPLTGDFPTLLQGPADRPQRIPTAPQRHVLGVSLPPGALRCLIGEAAPTWNAAVPLSDVAGAFAHTLQDRLVEASPEERLGLLGSALHARFGSLPTPSPTLRHCLAHLGAGKPIASLRDDLGWSHRRLIHFVVQHTGYRPKALARLLRFRRSLRHLNTQPRASLGQLARNLGYADQAHWTREFRHFSGITPAAYRPRTPTEPSHVPTKNAQ